MPFTLCHPGFMLPLIKKNDKLSVESIFIGSMVPDFDILFRFSENRFHLFSFSPLNILLIIFPLGIFTLIFYHLFLSFGMGKIFLFKISSFKTERFGIEIFTIFTAIIIHILLDLIGHPDAWTYANLISIFFGIQKYFNTTFYFLMYLPIIVLSIYGFILTIKMLNIDFFNYLKSLLLNKDCLTNNILILLFSLVLFVIKINFAGLEKNFEIDCLIIHLTSSFFTLTIIYCFILTMKNYYQNGIKWK